MRVLALENDRVLSEALQRILAPRYFLTVAESCAKAQALLQNQPFDLILLDVQLPDGSGFDLCWALKNRPHPPILMLTVFDDEASTLNGFACGADDYVTKPFSGRILLARIEALLRRSGAVARGQTAAAGAASRPDRLAEGRQVCLARFLPGIFAGGGGYPHRTTGQ